MLLKNNYIFVRPGEKAFRAASNYVNYVELGVPGGDGFYLVATIEEGEFLFSARLYDESGSFLCHVQRNNVVEGEGVVTQFRPEGGYDILDSSGNLILRLALAGDRKELCLLQGSFYDESSALVAEGDQDDFRIFKPPAVLGKSGAARGIVIEAPVTKPMTA